MQQPKFHSDSHPEIPEKLYFRIGEVSRLVGVAPYVLRYWESEFPSLAPNKSGTGHRFYRRKDVELLLQIKQLLYDKRFTIAGARRYMQVEGRPARRARAKGDQPDLFGASPADLKAIRDELAALAELLK
jgi:DNA-binding transcriptional MerR regulator